jgi:hypothetical protein
MVSQVHKYLTQEYRPTEVIRDYFNIELAKTYHMEQKIEVMEADDAESAEELSEAGQEAHQGVPEVI